MAHYLILLRDEIISNCRNKIVQFTALFALLDESKRIHLLILISQYFTVKYDELGYPSKEDSNRWMTTTKRTVAASPSQIRKYVQAILTARDDVNHCYGTEQQMKSWSDVWDNGYMEEALKYEDLV